MIQTDKKDFPGGLKVIRLETCDSTNNYLKENYEDLKRDFPVLVTAVQQTGGRGRDERTWVSERNHGLYSSFGFFLRAPHNLGILPLTTGISIIDTVKKISGYECGLKWPNDVLYNRRKLAGVLIENRISDTLVFCIVGIGINLNQARVDFPYELQKKAISLKMIARSESSFDPGSVNAVLSSVFLAWLEKLENNSLLEILAATRQYSAFLVDQPIRFHHPHTRALIRGIFKCITADGGVMLMTHDGNTVVHYSGEILS